MDITDIKHLLQIMLDENASDLHLCVGQPPVFRINGGLRRLGRRILEQSELEQMLTTISPNGNGNGKRLFTMGKEIDFGIAVEGLARFRVNIYQDTNGVCSAFRLIPFQIPSAKKLGLPDVVSEVYKMKRGLVLVTGITGCGKSTTLASIIDRINDERNEHIITIEDPIEFVHQHKKCIINQREVGVNTASFSNALRGALREDPDIILVGEMRDLETVSLAITAAETGHLVLATLHTRGAAQSVDRIIDVFPPYQQEQIRIQLADTIEMIISQVLLPSISGSRRHLACEVMTGTGGIKQLIRQKKTHQIKSEIVSGRQYGMISLEQSLKELTRRKIIAESVALQWATDKKLFKEL